ncbi:histidine kinase [Flavobacterium psychrophilum]|nr:histidine kinase [Flavobacterium psychrophilum]AOE54038.1 histidine kinase [Flavobacterium psychrophilum]
MNKTRFRLLVFFMSLSLIGIILVQLYWVNISFKSSDQQFQYRVGHISDRVVYRLEDQELRKFLDVYDNFTKTYGHEPSRKELKKVYERNNRKRQGNIIYADNVTGGDYSENYADTNADSKKEKKSAKLQANNIDYEKRTLLYNNTLYLQDFREYNTIETWVTKDVVYGMIASELKSYDVNTDFEFAIYKDELATKIKSDNFSYIENNLFEFPVFEDPDGATRFALLMSFPKKETFLISEILGITSLSIIFTLIIIIAYLSAINQLIKQKQISEIKTDFINNMTHEFKTPIATINLALDSIRNPKIFGDAEKVQRYLQMIRDENKRMHAQVENVLQISRLDKKELDITKDQADIHDVIEGAIEHVHLIVEARHGTLTRHFDAQRTTTLLNDVHFTNVLVNILDNAIKYSPDEPVIDIYTENVKDFILIKIKDNGLGMSKVVQKRIFEKFYREHTGDLHNVKGHGLGLAYVKRIIDDHNSHIYVESEKGKGSTFIIKMPLIN